MVFVLHHVPPAVWGNWNSWQGQQIECYGGCCQCLSCSNEAHAGSRIRSRHGKNGFFPCSRLSCSCSTGWSQQSSLWASRSSPIRPCAGACLQPPEHCWLLCEYLPGGSLSAWLHGSRLQGGRCVRGFLDTGFGCIGLQSACHIQILCRPAVFRRAITHTWALGAKHTGVCHHPVLTLQLP